VGTHPFVPSLYLSARHGASLRVTRREVVTDPLRTACPPRWPTEAAYLGFRDTTHGSHEEADPVAELIYSAITSLDGYVADEEGNFDWAAPDDEVHGLVNDLERPIGTYLYGRRMYEGGVPGDRAHGRRPVTPPALDYAEIWQAADKVYSTTLMTASSARTRIERDFDPETVRDMKASADRDLSVVGPGLADRGGWRHAVAPRRRRARARGGRRFDSGVVFLRYRTKT
jgi:hypothetical protein